MKKIKRNTILNRHHKQLWRKIYLKQGNRRLLGDTRTFKTVNIRNVAEFTTAKSDRCQIWHLSLRGPCSMFEQVNRLFRSL